MHAQAAGSVLFCTDHRHSKNSSRTRGLCRQACQLVLLQRGPAVKEAVLPPASLAYINFQSVLTCHIDVNLLRPLDNLLVRQADGKM